MTPYLFEKWLCNWSTTFELEDQQWKENSLDDLGLLNSSNRGSDKSVRSTISTPPRTQTCRCAFWPQFTKNSSHKTEHASIQRYVGTGTKRLRDLQSIVSGNATKYYRVFPVQLTCSSAMKHIVNCVAASISKMSDIEQNIKNYEIKVIHSSSHY